MQQSPSPTISVVVVEDEAELAELYRRYLEDEYDVQIAYTGAEALEIVDETVDVVLLDRKLDGMLGRDVLAEIRDRGYEMPVALVTGVEPDEDIVEMPFDEYLTKPIDRETLRRAVQRLVNRSSFEERSRRYFRLASKKASLGSQGGSGREERAGFERVERQMAELQEELDTTISSLRSTRPQSIHHSEPDPAEIQTLLDEIADHSLPEELAALVEEYQALKNARPPFMWKWVHRLAPHNTLPCVDEQYREKVPVDKTLLILYITLLDDVLEKANDRATFTELSKIPFDLPTETAPKHGVDEDYLAFGRNVWETIAERIEGSPNYDRYVDLLRYDIEQAINAIEYSTIAIQRPELSTMSDLERYESHNMVLFAYADIDLMHSSTDVRGEFGTLREAIWTAQLMARIGNWVSTWQRELREGDFSAGPIVYALEQDIVAHEELTAIDKGDTERADALIERIEAAGVEEEFLRRWEDHFHELREYERELSSFDLGPFVDGTEEVLRYHLASTGLK